MLKPNLISITLGTSMKKILLLNAITLILLPSYSLPKATYTHEATIDSDKSRSIMMQIGNSFLLSQAIAAAARLGIADQLTHTNKTCAQLAQELNLHEESLYRLMRMLVSHSIFTVNSMQEYGLTDVGQLLVTDNPKSLRYFLMMDDYSRWSAYANLDQAIKTGKTAFEITHGTYFFDFIKNNPEAQALFNNGMQNISCNESELIAKSLVINSHEETSIVDIGGGNGGLMLSILSKFPTIKQAVIFDYTDLDQVTTKNLTAAGIEFKQGSFFDADTIPAEKTIYILKRVLHDWSDADSIKILKNCAAAMGENSSLLIIETIIQDNTNYDIGKDIDIVMMALFGGKERSAEEFTQLINKAGLKVTTITPITNSMLSIINIQRETAI